jgi:hypothetical protein
MTRLKPKITQEEARLDHARMLRFLALNAAAGMTLGIVATALLLFFDVAGIGSRIARASSPVLPLLLIGFPMALIFGGAVTATAVWTMPYERLFAPEPRKKDDDENNGREPRQR